MQTTNHILMIRPVDFKFNEQTAGNKAEAKSPKAATPKAPAATTDVNAKGAAQ